MNPLATTGVLQKKAGIGAQDRLPVLRDTRPLSSDEVTNDTIEFFQVNPNRSNVDRNYSQNPLTGNYTKRVVSLGFGFTQPLFKPATNVDPVSILNDLKHAAVVADVGERSSKKMREHLTNFIDFSQVKVVEAAYDDGSNDGAYRAVQFCHVPFRLLSDPYAIVMGPDVPFQLSIIPLWR